MGARERSVPGGVIACGELGSEGVDIKPGSELEVTAGIEGWIVLVCFMVSAISLNFFSLFEVCRIAHEWLLTYNCTFARPSTH